MTKDQLSAKYFLATSRVHSLTNELYEKLHDDKGSPLTETVDVATRILEYKKSLLEEVTLITESVKEHAELS